MSYRVLALDPNSQHMQVTVLRKIRDMVNAGATVVGPKPVDSPSLHDDQAEFKSIADQLWSGRTGKGSIIASGTIGEEARHPQDPRRFRMRKAAVRYRACLSSPQTCRRRLYWA